METIDQICSWLVANWFGVLAMAVGLVATFLVYLWQKKDKRPVYAVRNVVIIQKAKDTFPSLQVHYRGHGDDLENLSATLIAIWNSGRETIHSIDIASAKPLTITGVGGVKLLGSSIVQMNNSASKATCNYNKNSNQVMLTFEYLSRPAEIFSH